ncbi:MAG: EamA family transporter, partial [Gammaproteobacteria bacterium]|nr:EamA family transporter [Gammaproteobacteria bacterium]
GAGMLHVAVAGILIHATYLGGVFVAIHRGLPAGTAALVTALQPLLTAIAAGPYLGERITARQWIGLILGLFGVLLVVQRKLGVSEGDIGAVIAALIAVLGITAGTLYQKRHGGAMDVRTGSVVQFGASALVILPLAWLSETMEVRWSSEFVFALGWLCVVLSLGAISLLLWLIRHGAAARVASLFYMVPPATAVTAWILFDETFGLDGLIGMAVVVTGVALVTVSPKPS